MEVLTDCMFPTASGNSQSVVYVRQQISEPKMLWQSHDFGVCRPGVFFTAKADGRLDVWDFMHKQHEPALSAHVADVPLTSLKLQA